MKRRPFYGRQSELAILQEELKKKSASLVVIHGRRRIGKSRLIEEFSGKIQSIHLSGLPPTTKTSDTSQRKEFASQMALGLRLPEPPHNDWTELFWHLARETSQGEWLVVLDEISWMGSKEPDFLGKLKNAWDLHFSKNSNLLLILCGSVSSWIEKNILSNTGFLGRVSIDLVLEELPLHDCCKFWGSCQKTVSSYEIFKLLSVTGGVPKYLEEIIPQKSAEENIHRLCFTPRGLLFREFEQIFSDLFSKRSDLYRKIVHQLVDGPLALEELAGKLKIEKGGALSGYLFDLEEAGFIRSDWTWNIKTKKISNLRKYRLSDNYLRFYLKYIYPIKEKIVQNRIGKEPFISLSYFSIIMGLQFENLVMSNRDGLYKMLSISLSDVEMANPFFQRKTARQEGCQIDLMIQTRHRILYLVEIKFSQSKIGLTVAEKMQETVTRLSVPKGISMRTALIHVNGVTAEVVESGIFDYIIDFSSLLKMI